MKRSLNSAIREWVAWLGLRLQLRVRSPHGLRAFVVGCEGHVGKLIKANLERQGYEIVLCADMDHAARSARETPPSLVFVDFIGSASEFELMVRFHKAGIEVCEIGDPKEGNPFEKTRFINIRAMGIGHLGPWKWPDDFFSGPTAGAVVTDR